MSLQTIINNASAITIDRRKVGGYTISRSGRVKVASIASNVPWQFRVKMHDGLTYSANRYVLESIDYNDRVIKSTINIGSSNTGLAYLTQYKGDLNSTAINSITVANANVLTLTLDVSNTGVGSGTVLFQPGDYLQLGGAYKYPYTVTSQVTRGGSSTVNVPINRPFIEQSGYTTVGANIVVGSAVTWNVLVTRRPSYTVVPYDRIAWNGEFELIEVIED